MPRLPMVKSLFQVMRAVQEFTVQEGIADIDGWITSGESKRGWTTALSGGVKCPTCAAKIIAIAPKVPIMPNIIEDIHYQW
jgi:PhoPQ-activated pathogenicity-related protein